MRSCTILQESGKILIEIKILIRSCLRFQILKDPNENIARSYHKISIKPYTDLNENLVRCSENLPRSYQQEIQYPTF